MRATKNILTFIVGLMAFLSLGAQQVYADTSRLCGYNICVDGDFGITFADPTVSTVDATALIMAGVFALGVVLVINGKFIKNLVKRK